ncbi:hypothetical protein GF420_03260, partial [candidate division GN15 bacterium]|nr:hypothetical protein [candidate division GN15 bacterium]
MTSAVRQFEPEPQVYLIRAQEGAWLQWRPMPKLDRPYAEVANFQVADVIGPDSVVINARQLCTRVPEGEEAYRSRVDTLVVGDTLLYIPKMAEQWVKFTLGPQPPPDIAWQKWEGCASYRLTDTLPPPDSVLSREQYACEGWLKRRCQVWIEACRRLIPHGLVTIWSGPN